MPEVIDAFVNALRSGSADSDSLVDRLEDVNAVGSLGQTPLGASTFFGRPDLAA
jgi:hypothetical protein